MRADTSTRSLKCLGGLALLALLAAACGRAPATESAHESVATEGADEQGSALVGGVEVRPGPTTAQEWLLESIPASATSTRNPMVLRVDEPMKPSVEELERLVAAALPPDAVPVERRLDRNQGVDGTITDVADVRYESPDHSRLRVVQQQLPTYMPLEVLVGRHGLAQGSYSVADVSTGVEVSIFTALPEAVQLVHISQTGAFTNVMAAAPDSSDAELMQRARAVMDSVLQGSSSG